MKAGPTFSHATVHLALLIALSGCSIAMALHGHPEPNFDKIQVGATREDVEQEFGKPVSSKVLESGQHEATFIYEMANSPNPGRATVYGYIDLATIGLAEPILTLIELFQGHDEETTVVFDGAGTVVNIAGYWPPSPSPVLVQAEESQRRYTKSSLGSPAPQDGVAAGEFSEDHTLSVDAKVKQLAQHLSTHLRNHKLQRIAVLPARDAVGNEGQRLGNYLTEKLTAKLHEENAARIVERSQLDRVTQELYLTHTGGFDEESAMKIGNLLGVEAVISTLYADIGPSSIDVNSKVVHVETGEILGVANMALPRSAVERMLPH